MESHTMVVTNQGELLVFGGSNSDEIFNAVWVFDPETSAFRLAYATGLVAISSILKLKRLSCTNRCLHFYQNEL